MKKILLFAVVITLMTVLPVSAQGPETNLVDSCVTDFDAAVDYFPDKVQIEDAENLSVEYFNNYKVLTVFDAFDNAPVYTYVLVQCGTPAPDTDDFENAQVVEVPAGDIITMSTTFLPHITDLGLIENLIGLDTAFYVSNPQVLDRFDAGNLVEIGSGSAVNVEVALDSEPDIILSYGFNPDTDAHPVLTEAGIFTALSADWRETTPLGRAEWIKFTALFFNAEAAATDVYSNIVTEYETVRELASTIPQEERPVVLWNSFSGFSDAWLIPGAETYTGQLIAEAGGIIALGDEAPADSAPLSFEVVYDGALDADIWVTNLFAVSSVDDLLAQDERYADFDAVNSGDVWNNDLDVNENGGSNYFELGVTNPHLILQDLVAIFHPELLPDHEFNFYRSLDQ